MFTKNDIPSACLCNDALVLLQMGEICIIRVVMNATNVAMCVRHIVVVCTAQCVPILCLLLVLNRFPSH